MMLVRAPAITLAAAAITALAAAGCPPGLSDPDRFASGCPSDYSVEAMMRDRCSGSGCHGVDAPAAGLDLVSAGAFARMYGAASACGDPLIAPTGAPASLLVHKLDGTTTCGARMPLGAEPLAAADLACVEAWIAENIAAWTGPIPGGDAGAGGAGGGGG